MGQYQGKLPRLQGHLTWDESARQQRGPQVDAPWAPPPGVRVSCAQCWPKLLLWAGPAMTTAPSHPRAQDGSPTSTQTSDAPSPLGLLFPISFFSIPERTGGAESAEPDLLGSLRQFPLVGSHTQRGATYPANKLLSLRRRPRARGTELMSTNRY